MACVPKSPVEAVKKRIGNSTWTVIHSFLYKIQCSGVEGQDIRMSLARYKTIVMYLMMQYPCEACRVHIRASMDGWMEALDSACKGAEKRDRERVVNDVAIWAFRVHNDVTRTVHGSAARNEFIDMQAQLDAGEGRDEIIRRLDELYNIVYDVTDTS